MSAASRQAIQVRIETIGTACWLLMDLFWMLEQPEAATVAAFVTLAAWLAVFGYVRRSVAEWAATLPKDKPVVTYCLYGFQISRNATDELRRRGIDARSLAGGIASWRASGGPTTALEPPAS